VQKAHKKSSNSDKQKFFMRESKIIRQNKRFNCHVTKFTDGESILFAPGAPHSDYWKTIHDARDIHFTVANIKYEQIVFHWTEKRILTEDKKELYRS